MKKQRELNADRRYISNGAAVAPSETVRNGACLRRSGRTRSLAGQLPKETEEGKLGKRALLIDSGKRNRETRPRSACGNGRPSPSNHELESSGMPRLQPQKGESTI